MAKQVFEFTDEEVVQLLWERLIAQGKVGKDGTADITAILNGWGKKGFSIRIKIG